ncbi:MAG TPA: amino acid racemase [Terriglobales bacterium]|jgi:aspartate racemase|nr:amino acid racemase [Terriglobales bacterium]
MKTIGMIGGIGPESTIEYYRLIIASYRERITDGSYPFMIVNSIDLQKLRNMAEADERVKMAEFLVSEIQKLARAGAECGLMAANTPHMVFDEVRRESPIPLISIVEATCRAAKAMGLKKLGLFGTRMTMQGRFYPDVFSGEGIALAVPDEHDQAYIHHVYFNELVKGIVLPETRQRLLKIVEGLKERESIQGLILGGTELSLILRDETVCDIPALDTTKIHAKAIVAEALAE